MKIQLHKGDLPEGLGFGPVLAIDTEAMGLLPHRDRLCLAQMTDGSGTVHIVQFGRPPIHAPRLAALLADPNTLKLFHYARFDLGLLKQALGVMPRPVYCTKIASRLTRTYTDKHGLKDLTKDILGLELSKQQQSSDWGAETLSQAQLDYAASDVIHLHALRTHFDKVLQREGRLALAEQIFQYLPARAELDLMGWTEDDILSH